MGGNIIGRVNEQKLLKELCDDNSPRLIAIYGRRRVGKTFLVKEFFNNTFCFSFTGSYNTAAKIQLELFRQELEQHQYAIPKSFKSWFEAFSELRKYLESVSDKKKIVFLDELPWMDTPRSSFLAAFSYFWNTYGSTCTGLKLIICGSATSWMLNKIIGDKGGLYGRCSRTIYIPPFNLNEVEQMLHQKGIQWSRYQIVESYMIFGGIPYYLDMLDKSLPFQQNIDTLFFAEHAPLQTEYGFLFRSLFREAELYYRIVECLASRLQGMTQEQLGEALSVQSGGRLTKTLQDLISCDFIRSYNMHGRKSKSTLYQLTDLFTLFSLRFVVKKDQHDEHVWSNLNTYIHDQWSGYAFEMVCLHHVPQIKRALGIAGVHTEVYSWSFKSHTDADGYQWKGTQIDLLLERADKVIDICEIKYSTQPYVITKDYDEHLRERCQTFRVLTKTRKALRFVFITTYGLHPNMYAHSIPNSITMEELFT